MLIQLHHQPRKYEDSLNTEFIVQAEVFSNMEVRQLVDEYNKIHPPPKGMQWLFLLEESPLFVKTVDKEKK